MKLFNEIITVYKKYKKLKLDSFISKEELEYEKRKRFYFYFVVLALAIIHIIISSVNNAPQLKLFSIILLIGSIICILINKFTKGLSAPDITFGLLYVIIAIYFSFTGLTDSNDIIWLLIMPAFVFSFMKLDIAFAANTVILIFVLVSFFSPLHNSFRYPFDPSFIVRFPIMFIFSYIVISYIFISNSTTEKLSTIHTYIDELTGLGNRAYYNMYVKYMQSQGLTERDLIVASLDVNSLKKTNDELGHNYGDLLLAGAGKALKKAFNKSEIVARIGGDEFVVVTHESEDDFKKSLTRLDEECAKWKNDKIESLSISRGYSNSKDHPYVNPEKLYKLADEEMYKNKSEYYLKNNIERRKNG